MKDMLKLENVEIVDHVKDWIDAIHVSVKPLVDQGYCESRYIDEIIKNTRKFGPYYVLCENLALIHASSEQGVLKKQLAITVLKHPVRFKSDGYDVRVLVALAAEDSESHMHAIQAISNIFSQEERMQQMIAATSEKDIYNMFVNAADE